MDNVMGFLLGIKPAFLTSEHRKDAYLCKDYPFVSSGDFPAIPNGLVIFFQDEQQKQAYLSKYQAQLITTYGSEYHRCLGAMLGFPPLAIDYFIQQDELSKKINAAKPASDQLVDELIMLKKNHATLDYCGIRFVFNIAEVGEIVDWMWNQYGDVKMDVVEIQFIEQTFHIPFRDTEKFQQIQTTVLEMLKHRSFDHWEMRVIYHALNGALKDRELHEMHENIRAVLRDHY
ncbi:hypothetical protein [Shimazuella alba]|uniref:Uncharacterized protein n=1 Tax=Shimazuella alba TaxID=2690964 RepID=A0A6I4W4X9_9BACL|nr:hypothetical protein [Shimazuella alba]MXQ55824.1 hypothetical protein [Shimazuella alba]